MFSDYERAKRETLEIPSYSQLILKRSACFNQFLLNNIHVIISTV